MFYDRLLERLQELKLTGFKEERKILLDRWINSLRNSKLFLFDTEQAEVFMNNSYPFETYPYFVFPEIFINFTHPLEMVWPDIHMFDSTKWSVRERTSNVRRYQGVLIRQGNIGRLSPNRPLALSDLIESKGFFPFVDPEVASIENLKGGISSWYESFDKDGDIDSFEVAFGPSSFPSFENKELHRLYNTFDNAERLHALTINLLYFLSCENVNLEYHDPKSSRELFRRIGQRTYHPFYTVEFKRGGGRTRPVNTGAGTPHSYRYDVRGHFRHLRDERYQRNLDGTYKVIWVSSHQRGVENELYIPALRDAAKLPTVYP